MSDQNTQGVRKTRPAANGLAWLLQSISLVRSQAARQLFLAVLLQLILGLSQVPVLGLLVILAVPGLTAGLLEALHRVGSGKPVAASILFFPLTQRPANGRLLALGGVMFIVAAISVMLVMGGSDTQLDAELLQRVEQGDADAIGELDPELIFRVIWAAIIAISVTGTISFMAIPLIWFGQRATGKALLEGFQVLMRNWKAFFVLSLGLGVLLLPLGLVFIFMMQLAATMGPLSLVFAVLIMLFALAYQLLVIGTQYCAYRDIYELNVKPEDSGLPVRPDESENQDDKKDGDDGQFVA